jgi:hypothetical protein
VTRRPIFAGALMQGLKYMPLACNDIKLRGVVVNNWSVILQKKLTQEQNNPLIVTLPQLLHGPSILSSVSTPQTSCAQSAPLVGVRQCNYTVECIPYSVPWCTPKYCDRRVYSIACIPGYTDCSFHNGSTTPGVPQRTLVRGSTLNIFPRARDSAQCSLLH